MVVREAIFYFENYVIESVKLVKQVIGSGKNGGWCL